MADKKLVTVKCVVKSVFDDKLKPKVLKAMGLPIVKEIETKSGGKLTVKGGSSDGFLLTVTLVSLEADDDKKPKELSAKVNVSAVAVGSTAKAFNGSANGKTNGFGSRVESAAEDLVAGVLEGLMPKVVKTMLSL